MVHVCTFHINGTKVIVSRSYMEDQYLISKAVLGKLMFEPKHAPKSVQMEEDIECLIEQVNDNTIDDVELSADEQFALDVFRLGEIKQQQLIKTNGTVDYSSDNEFLTFWAENGQYLSWFRFTHAFPEFPKEIFDNLSSLSEHAAEDLNTKWNCISDETFAYAQLYWSTVVNPIY